MSRYTDIGEAVVTSSTISGRARIRVVQGRGFRTLAWLLVVATVLVLITTFWLGRNQQQSANLPSAEQDRPMDTQSEVISSKPAAQSAERVAESQPQLAAPAEAGSPQPVAHTTQQQAQNALSRAQQLERQGKVNEALEKYRAALLLEPTSEASRQAMVDLLLKAKRNADAERALQIGLKYNPKQSSYAMQLARLQVAKNAVAQALDTLLKAVPYAGQQAEYQAFVASLLQRQNRHADAVVYYQKALELQPNSGEWLMGVGVSLKAGNHMAEAHDAFRRALASPTLSAKSRAFVEEQLRQGEPPRKSAVVQPTTETSPPVAPAQ